MSQTLTYVMGADRRAHVDNIQDFKVDFSDDNHNWVQARQFERGMRQVFVNVTNEDGTPFDLTGCNVWFEGLLPKTADGDFRVIDDDGYVPLDPSAGKFRYDMPGHAFTVAGSYRQAFFRILKNNNSVTTLEFDLDVLADKVIDGLVPKTWIGPFNEIADQLVESLQKHTDDADKILADFQKKVGDLIAQLNQQGSTTTSMLTELQNRITDLETKIKQDGLFTQAEADTFKQLIVQMIKTQTINVFDSVDDMKHNASSLVEGMKVRTLSYYDNPADPYGGCLYKVCTAKTNLPAIDLGNGLYAVPILERSRIMNAACFGIKVNAEDDQADAIQEFLKSIPYNYKAYFPAGSYVLEHGIKIPGNREIFGDTTNVLNASWNGTGFFFKNLAENTVAIDAHTDGKQTVRSLWVQIEGAYTFEEDRTKTKTTNDNKMVSPFTITKSTSGIVGIYIGGYGSIAKDNVVVGASEAGIDSDAFCQIRDNQVWDSQIGIRTKSDMQISGNRVQHCEFGIQLNGAECNVVNERYDSISEMGYLLNQAHGSNLVNVQVDYCGGPGILLNDTSNCHISTQIGRTGIYYAGTEADDLASPTFAAGIALTGSSSYNRIDITQDYAGVFDNGTPDVRAPRYKVVTGQYYDEADTHAYHNDITLSGGGLDVQPGTKLTIDQLKRFMFIAGAPNHVVFSGSLTIYGTTYYYNTIDSTYDVGMIEQVPVIGYNDTPAITLDTLTLKRTIYSDDVINNNMDSLTSTGMYSWNGYAMTTSANLPPEKDTGVLLVMNTNDKITQFIMGGGSTIQSRVYSHTSWSSWRKANLV
ncbi:BppU family phage baseplate upper protein [Limosilactobacillus reuteri]|uniref:BppU family phage baseplate upper protein n=3 Tax=Limosilactobacillus reuteri TaxID=1598 RepID=UPI0015E871D5|nr:BppU family phage baseplate upper protein [Limosilactobacillus reuteri]